MILPWHWRSLPLNNRTGQEIFARLFLKENNIATLLESPCNSASQQPQLARYSLCAGRPRKIKDGLRLWTPKLGKVLPFLRQLLRESNHHFDSNNLPDSLPFIGGWLGWLGYDLAWEIEVLTALNPDPLPFPVAYWYEPESFAILDNYKQILWLATTEKSELDRLEAKLESEIITFSPPRYFPISARFLTSQEDYEAAVIKAKKYIRAGDIFQANLSVRFQANITANCWDIYRNLQAINPSPFASYWQTPWGNVISCSPERLIKLENDRAETRPIAGTRPRGNNLELDRKLEAELISNTKERAEHIMLVDLERNDLGKVCQWGTVKVDELLVIEKYSHVMHLVSNIIGNLKPEFDSIDLIKAVFPGGTITGCPKVRCLEIIEELEPFRRNLFYGSCGYLDLKGNLDLNILIRTLLSNNNRVWGQVGAGIVADSNPEKEWYESLQKAEAQLTALRSLN
ncbi:MAG: anthranilate synthase component I [Prochloraceae cyanobacterium]